MSQQKNPAGCILTRRSWLVLAATAASGCGGGTQSAGLPGTGGTGLYAQGSISGFSSVIVNGIKFDDSQASVQLDGSTATSADLRLGMTANVQGERGSSATLGKASSIEVWSAAQGVITEVTSSQFVLAGMTLEINSATVFDGIGSAALLSPGMRVAVWGLQAGVNGSLWTATRVAVVTSMSVVSTGLVSIVNSQYHLNGLLLTGLAGNHLVAGELVRVQGILSATGDSLQIANIKVLHGDSLPAREGEAEIEGVVTATRPGNRFTLGSIEVDASAASIDYATALMTVGMRCEVEGVWQADVLIATRVEPQEERILRLVTITALIEQFTSLANFVVRGQRCDATGVTQIVNGTVADLKVGATVILNGTKAGDVLMVTELALAIQA
jgi:hypothetical protein